MIYTSLSLYSEQLSPIIISDRLNYLDLKNLDDVYSDEIEGMAVSRKEEFLQGRFLAHFLLEQNGLKNPFIGRSEREPIWPRGFCGALTHSQDYIAATCAKKEKVESVGLDIETIGRVKESIREKIRTNDDLTSVPSMNKEELDTLIFSGKETLYKAIYPLCHIFFGMEDAAILSVDKSSFVIRLNRSLSSVFVKNKEFVGYYQIYNNSMITFMELRRERR